MLVAGGGCPWNRPGIWQPHGIGLRLSPDSPRRTADEAQDLFRILGLTSKFLAI
jgi:hypothetical protein